jgi:ribonuclease E
VIAEASAVEPKYTRVDSHTHSNTSTHHEHDHKHDDDHDHHDAHAESSTVEAVPTPAPVFVPTPVAVTPAPTPAPVSMPVTPAASQQSLDDVLKSAGLTMAVTNPDKLRQVQEATAVSTPPTRTPRERKSVVSAPSEPLVQIETQR